MGTALGDTEGPRAGEGVRAEARWGEEGTWAASCKALAWLQAIDTKSASSRSKRIQKQLPGVMG